MGVGVPGFEQVVPLPHLPVIKTDRPKHGDPLIHADLFFHTLSLFFVQFSIRVMAVTKKSLKCEVVVGSTPGNEVFFDLPEGGARGGGFQTPCGFVMLRISPPGKVDMVSNVNLNTSNV